MRAYFNDILVLVGLVIGGVTGMDDFLIKFFPKIHERKIHAKENNYCKYDDQLLQLFTSSLYLAALVASFGASKACSILGRKPTIMMASTLFMAGAALSAASENKWMLICGRILFGIGVGFGNEVFILGPFFLDHSLCKINLNFCFVRTLVVDYNKMGKERIKE